MADRTCSVEGCPRPHKARGLCKHHWQQWNRQWHREHEEPPSGNHPRGFCSIKDCPNPHEGHGLCSTHNWRVKQHGDPLADVPVRDLYRQGCSIPDCSKRHYSRGWCERHYQAWRAHGDPLKRINAPAGQADHYDSNGYHHISVGGRIVAEHRWVMEQALGRPLLPGENVHHRDGDRSRNTIDNLELWVTKQPKGQRVADLVAFVVERYPEQVARMLREQRRGAKPTEHPTLW